ncbi:MAG: oligosaccharide flippase family protein [Aquabacterium sp.]
MTAERNSLLRGVAWVAAAGYVEAAVGLIVGVFIARALGPADYGYYAYGIWVCGALLATSNHGLPSSAIKFIAETRGSDRPLLAAAIVSWLARLQWISSTLVLGGFALAMFIWPLPYWADNLPVMLLIALVAVWSRAGFWMWGSIGEGFEDFAPANLSLMLMAVLNLVSVVVMAFLGAGIVHYFALYAALGVISNLFLRWMLRQRDIRGRAGPIPTDLRSRFVRHLGLTGLLILLGVFVGRGIELTLLKAFSGPEAVGYYAIATALTRGATMIVVGGLAAVLLPAMSRRFGVGGTAALGGILVESARVYWMIGLVISGLGLAASDGLIHLLYGQQYDGAITALNWSLVAAGTMVTSGAAAAVLTASDRQVDRIRVALVTLGVNAIAGLVLIPRYELNGAIASTVLAHATELLLCWHYALKRVPVRLPWMPMLKQGFAAVVAGLLGYEVAELWHVKLAFLVGSLVFVVIYVPMCVVLRTLTAGDYALISQGLARLGGPGRGLSGWVLGLQRFARAG